MSVPFFGYQFPSISHVDVAVALLAAATRCSGQRLAELAPDLPAANTNRRLSTLQTSSSYLLCYCLILHLGSSGSGGFWVGWDEWCPAILVQSTPNNKGSAALNRQSTSQFGKQRFQHLGLI